MATVAIVPPANSIGATTTKHRYGVSGSVVVDTTLGNCDIVDIQEWANIAVKPSAGINSLSVYAAESAAGTFVLVDSLGTAGAVTVVASKWNVIDLTKLPFGFIKLVPNTNGTVIVIGKT